MFGVKMYDDDRDALAAEFVLGTLSADERDQAEALLAIDPGFAEIVRVWERRLGELNVMVEAVEPPPEVWNNIRTEIDLAGPRVAHRGEAIPAAEEAAAPAASAPELTLVVSPEPAMDLVPDLLSETARDLDEPPRDPDEAPPDSDEPPQQSDEPPQESDELRQGLDEPALVAALASQLLPPEEEAEAEGEVPAEALLPPELLQPLGPQPAARSADISRLQRGVRLWRSMTVAMSAIAAVLAAFVAVTQLAPGLLPLSRQPQPAVAAPPPPPGARFTAVLQQEPTAPAFLLTVDPQARTFTVRTVSAPPEAGRNYELWLTSSKNPSPRSLGLVGGEPFTTRPLPAGYDIDTIRTASYLISLEPAGGSPSGVPTGPILFRGKMVESVPGLPPG